MGYDEGLAERIRAILDERGDVAERRMFGGLAFLVRGHMSVGIAKEKLMVRVGLEAYAQALREPHARKMDFTGRALKGFVYVLPEGFESDADLERWVGRGVAFAAAQPSKAKERAPRPKRSVSPKAPSRKRKRG